MKKILLTFFVTLTALVSAQVIIGDASGTAANKASVLLEFAANQNKGIIVPYIRTLPSGAASVGGSIILDASSSTTTARMKFYNGTSWVDISGQDGIVTGALANQPTGITEAATSKAIIGADASAADGVLVLESTTKAMVLPTVTDVQSIPSPSPGMMVYVNKNGAKRLAVFNGNTWSFLKAPFNPVRSLTGRIWMDRNLGGEVARNATDEFSYGDLYQWGRLTDGHQVRNSSTTTTKSSTDIPGNALFINTPGDWRATSNNNLWQGVTGINNPCPTGYRLPTNDEFQLEVNSWTSKDLAGAFNSPLKLSAAGQRSDTNISDVATIGYYWTSTTRAGGNDTSRFLQISSSGFLLSNNFDTRGSGKAVRCIKD